MSNKTEKIILGITILVYASMSFSQELDCDKTFTIKLFGSEGQVCYAKNYTDYSPLEVANQFLKEQVLVKGGDFILKYKPSVKVNMPSFYFGEYLIPYQQFNTYLKETGQWDDGKLRPDTPYKLRLSSEKYNGLYPARASYDQAKGFCKWMSEITGLPVELPAYGQWLYAATSEGKNWEYPTNNGKLELGVNFPNYEATDQKSIDQLVTGLPVNSIGIHQIFGNGWQYSSTIYDAESSKYFPVLYGENGQVISGGRPYSDSLDLVKKFTLDSVFAITITKTHKAKGDFRCVINTDKPIPKHLDKLKD